jgi:alkylhydroperoxidase family enzyme
MSSHAAAARVLYGDKKNIVDLVIRDGEAAPVSPRMRALLVIAGHVQQNGKDVTESAIAVARTAGATDRDIHDTVLIAAAFSMYNRYVDGLASFTPTDPKAYEPMGERLASAGYILPKPVNELH